MAAKSWIVVRSEHRMKKREISRETDGVSRREFGRRVAITLAGGTLAATVLPVRAGAMGDIPLLDLPPQEQSGPTLSKQAQSEVDAKLQHIFAKYGDRLSDDQRKLMRRTVENHVRMLEAIRPIPVTNGDPPATVLKLVTDKSSVHSRTSALSRTARKPRKVARSVKKEK